MWVEAAVGTVAARWLACVTAVVANATWFASDAEGVFDMKAEALLEDIPRIAATRYASMLPSFLVVLPLARMTLVGRYDGISCVRDTSMPTPVVLVLAAGALEQRFRMALASTIMTGVAIIKMEHRLLRKRRS